jgi:uncharacterized protein YdhG (YjbR/CyaY superfamily)
MKRSSSPGKRPRPKDSGDVEAYLTSLPPDARAALQKIRQAIRAAAPDAVEGFSYGLPAFRLGGRPLVCYAASKNHCSFYPMSPAVIRAHGRDLEGYETSKGTIRFPPGAPLPSALVLKLVLARIAEIRKAER